MSQQQRIGRTIAESTPAFPTPALAPEGAPNVVVILLDDMGFAQLGCFGSDIETPTFDRLAAGGLRYQRFHVTALCSPTRASLLTGRNHHAVGMGFLTDVPTGFPGYSGRIPKSAATLPRILADHGYSTFHVGKWHLTPRWERSGTGPFDRWPLGLGFHRSYGFPDGDTNQYGPNLVRDNTPVEQPRAWDDGYTLNEDLADEAIRMITQQQQVNPEKPFFLYYAPGAMHAPHQAPPEWIERYAGRYDEGWDAWRDRVFDRQRELGIIPADTTPTERPDGLAAWADLSDDEQRVFARQMEVFAGFLSHTDHHVGRVVAHLEELGILDNTVVMVCSDNGASAEGGVHGSFNEHSWTGGPEDDFALSLERIDELGGPRAYNHYAWGWAWAGNTPFRMWKRYAWLGGVRTPLIVHWPRGIAARGEVRPQFCHVIDLAPTVLDLVGIEAPDVVDGVDQLPMHGGSLVPSFTDPEAPSPRDTQYFEMLGSRAIVRGRWKATTDHISQGVPSEVVIEGSRAFEDDRWSLFDLDADFSEAHDLAAEHPERVAELEHLWWAEAGRYDVLPIDDTLTQRAVAIEPPPYPMRTTAVFRPGIAAGDRIPILTGGFTLTAHLDPLAADDQGVVCAHGDWVNGWGLLVLDGRPTFVVDRFSVEHRVAAAAPCPGATTLEVRYERSPEGGGTVRLLADGTEIATGTMPRDLPFMWQIGGAPVCVGRDRGLPLVDDYRAPFPFTGRIHTVELTVPSFTRPDAHQVRTALATE